MEYLIVSVIMTLGALFILLAAIGIVKFNDFYSRVHASTKATSFGILLLLLSTSLFFGSWNVIIKTLLVIVFIYLTAPLAAHSIAKSFNDESGKKEN